MKIKLIRIGNSEGIRLPKSFIEECQLSGIVEITITQDKHLLIKRAEPEENPRADWPRQIQECIQKYGYPEPIGTEVVNAFDREEWDWPEEALADAEDEDGEES